MAFLDRPQRADTQEVLYVEDGSVNVLLMQALFECRPQFKLRVAVDVQSALRLAPTIQPALLLLDLRLPDGDGCDLLAQLRQMRHLALVPAIAVTAEYDFDVHGTGFVELWRKPIDIARVLTSLDHWLDTDVLVDPRRHAAAVVAASQSLGGQQGGSHRQSSGY